MRKSVVSNGRERERLKFKLLFKSSIEDNSNLELRINSYNWYNKKPPTLQALRIFEYLYEEQ